LTVVYKSQRKVGAKQKKIMEKSVLKLWLNRIKGKDLTKDNELMFLMKEDLRRNLFLHSIK
jgi:hypothetical protein